MAGPLVTTGNLAAVVNRYFDKRLLSVARPLLTHAKPAARRELPTGSTKTIAWRRMTKLALATAPLVEGTPPTGKTMGKTDVTVTIQQYGDFIPISDLERVTLDHPALNAATELLGIQSGETLDVLMRDEELATGTVLRGGNVTLRTDLLGVAHKIDKALVNRTIRTLQVADAQMFTKMIKAGAMESTFGIRPAYLCITHPDVIFTAQEVSGWKSVEEYSSTGPVMDGEVGAIDNMRFLSTTLSKIYLEGGGTKVGDVKGVTNADVYTGLVFGQEAIAYVPLAGNSMNNIIKPVGSAGSNDPLNQVGTSGWKHVGARKILNDGYMALMEVTAGLLNP